MSSANLTVTKRQRTTALFAALLMFLLVVINQSSASLAFAQDDYPSWDDVVNARNDEKRTAVEIKRIENFIEQLEVSLIPLQEIAKNAGELWATAQRNLDDATYQAELLQTQADEAQIKADQSAKQAGILASQFGKTSGNDLTMHLLMNSHEAEDLLYQLGAINQLSNQTSQIFAQATADRNNAQSLSDQALVAQEALAVYEKEASDTFQAAQKAQLDVENKLAEQQAARTDLGAKLVSLKEKRMVTEEEYRQGIIQNTGSDAIIDSAYVSLQGWTRPIQGGYLTSPYGNRGCVNQWCAFHTGLDFGGVNPAGGSCGGTIYAAAGGVVQYAGWYDSMSGNQIIINHGNGVVTWYAHLQTGGIKVKNGQEVAAGQAIALAGRTGASTGCHLHLEVRINGKHTSPIPFFAAKGVKL